jgi:hypothetical protein
VRNAIHTLTLLALTTAGCGAADSSAIVDNSSFDRRCVETLCDWEEAGSVIATRTWHRQDLAVSFESQGAEISQLVEQPGFGCFLFDTIAEVDVLARLTLYVDFDDGSRQTQQLVPAGWRSVSFTFVTPPSYQSVRFTVRKEGTGKAVLAQLRVVGLSSCEAGAFSSAERAE